MKKTIGNLFGKSAVLAVGAFVALCPVAAMAREGGGHAGGGARLSGGSSARFSGGGARFSGRADGHFGVRDFRGGGYYRGGVYVGIGGYPYAGYGYAPGYAYDPGYVYGPAYGPAQVTVPQTCAPAYDQYGNPIRNPACYAAPQQQYAPQQQQQYAPQQYYGQPQQ